MMTNLMTISVKKDSIPSKIKTVYYVVPASMRAIFIQDFAKGEIFYKVKKTGKKQSLLPCLFMYIVGQLFINAAPSP